MPHSPLWIPGTRLVQQDREWIIHHTSHRPPGSPQHCFVLQICSPTESNQAGRFVWEMFKQKPCVTERAPCAFGTQLPPLRLLVSAWLTNKSTSIKAKSIRHGTGQKTLLPCSVSDESVMQPDKNLFSPQWSHINCLTWAHKMKKAYWTGTLKWLLDLDACHWI